MSVPLPAVKSGFWAISTKAVTGAVPSTAFWTIVDIGLHRQDELRGLRGGAGRLPHALDVGVDAREVLRVDGDDGGAEVLAAS